MVEARRARATVVAWTRQGRYPAVVETTVADSHLASTIRTLRERAGLSQGDLAAAAGCSRAFVGLLEAGKRADVSLTLAAAMCDALGVDVTALLASPPGQDPVSRIVQALRAHGCKPTYHPAIHSWSEYWEAKCPLHPRTIVRRRPGPNDAAKEPRNAKVYQDLAVRLDPGSRRRAGGVRLYCARQCNPDDIMRALDLPKRLLRAREPLLRSVTVAELAAHTGLAEPFIRALGVRETGNGVDIPYCDALGAEVAVHRRLLLARPGRKPRSVTRPVPRPAVPVGGWAMSQRRDPRFGPAPDIPYGLDRLEDARAARYLLVVEGESDCWTCWAAGIPALGLPGAGWGAWTSGHAETAELIQAEHVRGIPTAYVVREPDPAGAAFARDVSDRLRAFGTEPWVVPFAMEPKDPNALYQEDPAGFRRALLGRLEVAISPERSAASKVGRED